MLLGIFLVIMAVADPYRSSSVETLHQTPSEGHQPDGNQALFLVTQQGKEAGRDEQVSVAL